MSTLFSTAGSARVQHTPPLANEASQLSGLPGSKKNVRRHDLDALRAIAMLLGIVLHAALSFSVIPWAVQDSKTSQFYDVLFALIHGFRMPLFFMLSGFFTAMLWRKRGLRNLLAQRTKRILLPLLLGCFTIIPAMWAVGYFVSLPSAGPAEQSPLFVAAVEGNLDQVREELRRPGVDLNAHDPASGSSPLCTAVFLGHKEVVELLVQAGADVDQPNLDRAAPIHIAVFTGRPEIAAILLEAGADRTVRDGNNFLPSELLNLDFGTTSFIAGSLGLPLEEETLREGRKKIAAQLGETEFLGSDAEAERKASLEGLKGLLFYLPAFMHLWFLWFLCWLIAAFVLYTFIAKLAPPGSLPGWLVCSPLSFLWLVPLTMAPQAFMQAETFGPDASVGLLPIPSVLGYYAIFFFFGAIYWENDDMQGRLGKWWYLYLPLGLVLVFPIGLDLVSGTLGLIDEVRRGSLPGWLGNFLQALFAWLMVFGSIGLFQRFLSRESRVLRYLSDSSYWLYLVHLPLVILAQWLVRDWSMPAFIKFAVITVGVFSVLIVTYAYGVRYTWIGHLLNGPRSRPSHALVKQAGAHPTAQENE